MSSQLAFSMTETETSTTKRRVSPLGWLAVLLGAALMGYLIYYNIAHLHEGHAGGAHHEAPPLWGIGILPFIALLGCIAILPLLPATHHWWESNLNRLGVALACGGAALVYYFFAEGPQQILPVLNHAVPAEYVPFIVLLFSLYVISGGICLKGDLAAHPSTNTAFLAFGALIASFIGTTGASMLLIRPLLQTNSERKHVVHTVVFFIFLVSNIGGCLLPIGDPPLFLGYLRGVAFFWTFHLVVEWAICCGVLLVIYFLLDTWFYRREKPRDIRRDETEKRPLRVTGGINILWLAGIVACVATISHEKEFLGTGWTPFPFLREVLMLGFVGISLLTTPKGAREDNQFNYAAILEVAALFIGIFIAMQVPIDVLRVYGPNLGLTQPWHFFWATGSLSSFLDNAPTYVVFFETAASFEETRLPETVIREPLLVGISLGAVFMGAMTYIGNGPNFMVKAIAEQSGVRMPSFFGYMFKYSIPMLVPVFVVITMIFLTGGNAAHEPSAAGGETHAAHVESTSAPATPAVHDEPAAPGH
ncbi:MAG: sodium:proton antiporter [Planctomycetota bacterium]|nr:sodium:proton antiporter [Planctomycetota bacterium]